MAIAVAYRAIQNGFDAFFTTAAALIDDLSAAFRAGELANARTPTSWLSSSITERKATTMATTKTTKTTKVLPVRGPLKREPTHPGEILREDVLPALRMNVSQAARELRRVTTAPAPHSGG